LPGTFGSDVVDTSRKDSTDIPMNFLKKNEVNSLIHSGLKIVCNEYKKIYPILDKLSRWEVNSEYNLQRYYPNQGYHVLHCENAGRDSKLERVLAWMIYLNDIEDGGGTSFPQYNRIIKSEEGKCVIWPAYWTHMHKGIVSKTQTKYIATGWFIWV
tara:strand:+ start:1159 stop:1626 length:468 start_codon:yes stop_codon:yes gene_type:complete